MSKTILIVEGDAAQSRNLAATLESAGYRVEETLDGKGSLDRIRDERPDLVLMAVDLSAGQNGYILCGKIKKDDDLRTVPLIIVGNSDGLAQHRKLKTRADDYVAKPVDEVALRVAVEGLMGPGETGGDAGDEFGADDFVEEVIAEDDGALSVDPDRLDDAFSDLTASGPLEDEESSSVEVPLEQSGEALGEGGAAQVLCTTAWG